MKHSLASCQDILPLYSAEGEIPSNNIVHTLIYSGTRHWTLKVLEVLDRACGTGGETLAPESKFTRRYHACTGELDKKDVISDFMLDKFSVISSTLALGMGQNWKSVRQVIHLGRGDPSLISQMIGRAGHDGKPSLAILFMEPTRKGGKNSTGAFSPGLVYDDEDRMDALALTPVCLRVALAVDKL